MAQFFVYLDFEYATFTAYRSSFSGPYAVQISFKSVVDMANHPGCIFIAMYTP